MQSQTKSLKLTKWRIKMGFVVSEWVSNVWCRRVRSPFERISCPNAEPLTSAAQPVTCIDGDQG